MEERESPYERAADDALRVLREAPPLALLAVVAALFELGLARVAWHGLPDVVDLETLRVLRDLGRFPRNLAAIAGIVGLLFALLYPRLSLDSPALAIAFAGGWLLFVSARLLVLDRLLQRLEAGKARVEIPEHCQRVGSGCGGGWNRRVFVVALQSMVVLAVGAPIVALTAPFLGAPWGLMALTILTVGLAVLFWRSATNLQGHVRAGATALVELLEKQMAQEHTPAALPTGDELLPGLGTTARVLLSETDWAAGRTLAELHVRALTGATILAIARSGETTAMPSGHDRLEIGDALLLAGAEHAVAAARQLLATGPEQTSAIDEPS